MGDIISISGDVNDYERDCKDWITLGFRKYVRMTPKQVMKRWNDLAIPLHGFGIPKIPEEGVVRRLIHEITMEQPAPVYHDVPRSREIKEDEYVSSKVLETWMGGRKGGL